MPAHTPIRWLLVLASAALLLAEVRSVEAYDAYSQNRDATNCAACHGDFNSGSYVSSHDGTAWGTDLMAGHSAMMAGDCGACHLSGPRFPVLTNVSAGGSNGFSTSGCIGCHGRQADAGHGEIDGRGAGLRQHHDRSGVTLCRGCHADANTATPLYTPVAESVEPFNYFTPDGAHPNKPTDPCDGDGSESAYGTTGLDNDGNGRYDAADPACAATTTSTLGATTTTLITTTTFGATTTTLGGTTTTLGNGTTTTTLGNGTTTTTVSATTTTMTTTTTLVDSDDDGIPDGDDPCNNSGARDIAIKAKVIAKKLDGAADDDRLIVKGEFASATPFASLDGTGLRVIGLRKDGSVAFDTPLPGTAVVDAKKISFRDDAGSNNGIVKFQLKDRSKKAPNQVKVLVKGKNGSYPFAPGDEPVRAIVVIGDGAAGECGETRFTAGQCVFNGAGNALKCR